MLSTFFFLFSLIIRRNNARHVRSFPRGFHTRKINIIQHVSFVRTGFFFLYDNTNRENSRALNSFLDTDKKKKYAFTTNHNCNTYMSNNQGSSCVRALNAQMSLHLVVYKENGQNMC